VRECAVRIQMASASLGALGQEIRELFVWIDPLVVDGPIVDHESVIKVKDEMQHPLL